MHSCGQIVIINGRAGVGKDTFVQFFAHHSDVDVFQWSSIDTVKTAAMDVFDWEGEKDDAGRLFLSDLKAAWIRYSDGPLRELCDKVNYYDRHFGRYVMFAHVREPEEIRKIVDIYAEADRRVVTLQIVSSRPEIGGTPDNASDLGTGGYNYTYTIDNSGAVDCLETAARELAYVWGYNGNG